MSTLKVHNIEPATGTDVALGAAGDTITISGDSIKLNTLKDSGGNTLFTSDGAGTVTSINTGIASGPRLIQSQTASGSASIDFTSGITSAYDKYMFVFIDINAATDQANFTVQVSTNGGSSYGVNVTSTFVMAFNEEGSGGNGLQYQGGLDLANSTSFQQIFYYMGNGADESGSGFLTLYSPSNTTYAKHWSARGNVNISGARSDDDMPQGYFNTTSAINAIQFKMSSGNFDGTIKMYGVI